MTTARSPRPVVACGPPGSACSPAASASLAPALLALLAVAALLAGGCGDRVTIQPGEVGRQLTINGLEDENRPPGAFRMDSCMITACPKLVRLRT